MLARKPRVAESRSMQSLATSFRIVSILLHPTGDDSTRERGNEQRGAMHSSRHRASAQFEGIVECANARDVHRHRARVSSAVCRSIRTLRVASHAIDDNEKRLARWWMNLHACCPSSACVARPPSVSILCRMAPLQQLRIVARYSRALKVFPRARGID